MEKTYTKGKKKITYKIAYYEQSLLQKIFHLTNIYFINESEKIILKDVAKKVATYVEAIKFKCKWKLAFFYWLYIAKML